MQARPGYDVKPDKATGLIPPTRGVSLNSNPNNPNVVRNGGAFEVKSIPEGLQIIRTKDDHFEIVPTRPMTVDDYNDLLKQVELEECK